VKLASALATARLKKGWTQQDLANESRVSIDVIRRIEQGADPDRSDETVTREPGFHIVSDLARGLSMSLDALDRAARRRRS
jgi:transcriptional regulator with XRE-family HTH domain